MNNTTELTIIIINIQHSRSSVGTLYALPWYLTWFGHSLNSYRDVVRLYDYFLASPFLMPLYVTVAIVLYRTDDIFKEDCDMASLHCLLSQVREKFIFGKKKSSDLSHFYKTSNIFSCALQLPENLPFEYLLQSAAVLYKAHPPEEVDVEVQKMIIKE